MKQTNQINFTFAVDKWKIQKYKPYCKNVLYKTMAGRFREFVDADLEGRIEIND